MREGEKLGGKRESVGGVKRNLWREVRKLEELIEKD